MKQTILIVDDEKTIRDTLSSLLESEGYAVDTAEDGISALDLLETAPPDLVITDLRMPRKGGLELMDEARASRPDLPFVIITSYATVENAVQALRGGAADYIVKPFLLDDVLMRIRNLLRISALSSENRVLRREVERARGGDHGLVYGSQAMEQVMSTVRKVAPSSSPILIYGESGTGKELIARAIHKESGVAGPFVAVNAGALPDHLIEAELFGHKKGAFTGAVAHREGLFRAAGGGTLFLDEIGELPLALQPKLLRAIEHHEIIPVGADRPISVDARIVSATNKELGVEVAEGRFRKDLFYRLHVVEIRIPPLRDRREDIPLLAAHFLARFAKELHRNVHAFEDGVLDRLACDTFPGNVRELSNMIERAMLVSEGARLRLPDFPGRHGMPRDPSHRGSSVPASIACPGGETIGDEVCVPMPLSAEGRTLKSAVGDFTRHCILSALERNDNNLKQAASDLGIALSSLYRKMQELDIAGSG